MQARPERWWSLGGIVFVVLFIIAFGLIGESGDTADEVLVFYENNEGS